MIKAAYFTKIAAEAGIIFEGAPVLLSKNEYGEVYSYNSNLGELIIKIGFKEGVVEKIPGLGKRRLANEFLFSSLLAGNKAMPKMVKINESGNSKYYPCLVYLKIEGDNLAELTEKHKISFSNLAAVYGNMGKELKMIHEIKLKKFGDLNNKNSFARKRQEKDWYDFFSDILGRCLKKVKKGHFKGKYPILKEYVERNMPLLLKKVKIIPSLLHGDFEPWNIIIKNNKFVGIIDSELAFGGHNLLDLTPEFPACLKEPQKEFLRNSFLKGYFGKRKPSPWELQCLDFYHDIKIITHRLVVWDFFTKTIDRKQKAEEKKKILRVLAKIEKKLRSC